MTVKLWMCGTLHASILRKIRRNNFLKMLGASELKRGVCYEIGGDTKKVTFKDLKTHIPKSEV